MHTHRLLPMASRSSGLLLALVLGSSLLSKGQNLASPPSLMVKVVPQYLVVGGYWVEVEQQRSQHPQQSFTLTPQLYLGPTAQPDASVSSPYYWPVEPQRTDEKVRGFGLQGQHRFYLKASKTSYPSGWYVSYGPHYQHFRISYNTMGYREIQGEDGLLYYAYGPIKQTTVINRYGAAVQAGYQAPLLPGRVFLDLYAGIGLRQSTNNSAYGISAYRSGPSDYGHRGWYFPGGVKVGVALR